MHLYVVQTMSVVYRCTLFSRASCCVLCTICSLVASTQPMIARCLILKNPTCIIRVFLQMRKKLWSPKSHSLTSRRIQSLQPAHVRPRRARKTVIQQLLSSRANLTFEMHCIAFYASSLGRIRTMYPTLWRNLYVVLHCLPVSDIVTHVVCNFSFAIRFRQWGTLYFAWNLLSTGWKRVYFAPLVTFPWWPDPLYNIIRRHPLCGMLVTDLAYSTHSTMRINIPKNCWRIFLSHIVWIRLHRCCRTVSTSGKTWTTCPPSHGTVLAFLE